MRIDQALFGYRSGHRLLAASTRLLPRVERTMLQLSDLSGPRLITGFGEYVTGFPIPEEYLYVLSRTWYANEMERPGCVWTHSLVIGVEDVKTLTDPSSLSKYFRRPQREAGFIEYEQGIVVDTSTDNELPIGHPDTVYALLDALYTPPFLPVIIKASQARECEHLLLRIWGLQWPALRARFKFCTGSLANRQLDAEPFDLQVMPPSVAADFERKVNDFKFPQQPTKADYDPAVSDFLMALRVGLDFNSTRFLREYLQMFVDRSLEDRSSFVKLASIFHAVARPDSNKLDDLVELTARIFPNSDEARTLKINLLGGEIPRPSWLPAATEIERLRFLALTPHWAAFNEPDLQIELRSTKAWNTDRNGARLILNSVLESEPTKFGEQFINAIAIEISVTDLCELERTRGGTAIVLIARNPLLATDSALWSSAIDSGISYDLLDTVCSLSLEDSLVDRVMKAILESQGGDRLLDAAIQRFGERGITAMLSWLSEKVVSSDLRFAVFASILAEHQNELKTWLESHHPQPTVLAAMALALTPNSWVLGSDSAMWLGLQSVTLEPTLRSDVCAFVLGLALLTSSPVGATLAAFSFETVHNAAEKRSLSYEAWQKLKSIVPSLGKYRDWDKCERLRRALNRAFDEHGWPIREYFRCARSEEVFRALIQSANNLGMWPLLARLSESALSGSAETNQAQIHLLINR